MSNEDIKRELKEIRRKSGTSVEKRVLAEKYKKAIALLPPFEAQILQMYYIDGMTHERIARKVYYSADSVRRILKRGIGMLAEKTK